MPDPFAVIPGKKRQHGGYAHFPGTGPEGKACKACEHSAPKPRSTKFICLKWIELMYPNGGGSRQKAGEIDLGSPACKYFKEKDHKGRTPYAAARGW